jgi:hypothetical protein
MTLTTRSKALQTLLVDILIDVDTSTGYHYKHIVVSSTRFDIEKMLDLARNMATSHFLTNFLLLASRFFELRISRETAFLPGLFLLHFLSRTCVFFLNFFVCFVTCAKSHEGTKMNIWWELPLCCF